MYQKTHCYCYLQENYQESGFFHILNLGNDLTRVADKSEISLVSCL